MQGLCPRAIKSLPPQSLLAFSAEQLSKMSFSAARAISPSQFNNLAPAEATALRSVLEVQPEMFIVSVASDADNVHPEVQRDVTDGVDPRAHGGEGKTTTDGTTTTTPAPSSTETPPTSTSPEKLSPAVTFFSYYLLAAIITLNQIIIV